MKSKLSNSKFCNVLFVFFLIMGLQNSLQAQIQVTNNTLCVIEVAVGQNDLNTFNPCDLCPINPPTLIPIDPGDTEDIYGQDECGEEAAWIRWRVVGSLGSGASPNPGLLNFCNYPNFPGPGCFSFSTNATWNTSGTGYVSVTIN